MKQKTLVLLAVLFGFAALLALLSGSGSVAKGAAPGRAPSEATVPYSGQLSDELGQPVADGAYAFRFELYSAAQGGKLLWSETQSGVAVTGGTFTTQLGRVAALPTSARADGLWLAVSVRGPDEADFTLLNPRQLIDAAVASAPASPAAAAACAHDHFGELWNGDATGMPAGGGLKISSNYNAIEGVSTGSGVGLQGSSANGAGISGWSTNMIGITAQTNTANFPALMATGWTSTSPALEINGSFHVTDAGIDTDTTVFIHRVNTASGGNLCASQAYSTVIDNPIINSEPGAILIVTPNYGSNTSGVGPAIGIPAVFYDSANTCGKGNNKWVIYNLNGTAQTNNSMFNVLVVLP